MQNFLQHLNDKGVRVCLKDSKAFFLHLQEDPKLFWNTNFDSLEVMSYLLNQPVNSAQNGRQMLFNEGMLNTYIAVENKLPLVLCDMERAGIMVCPTKLEALKQEILKQIDVLSKEIFEIAGEEFNINSPKQVSHILFEKMGLKAGKKTAGGELSSNSDVLEELAEEVPIASKLIEIRHLYKLLNTYITVFLEKASASPDGRIRTSFLSTVTLTGRLNSKNPNLQNLPAKTEIGVKIKQCFMAREGFELISFDYSQIDLRMLAHIANVMPLKDAFLKGEDIHQKTASDIFEVPIEQVTKEQRKYAKAINFGIIYGLSAFALAKNLGITTSKANEYIQNYFLKYEGIKKYIDETSKEAVEKGYVRTILGKKCFLPDVKSANFTQRSHSIRAGVNARIQGSSADLIKKAMIMMYQNNVIDETCKLILQIHDELVFEIKKDAIAEKQKIISGIMKNAIHLEVPLVVNFENYI